MDHMGVIGKVWPLAADAHGVWLLSDDAWRTDRIGAACGVHDEVEAVLWRHGIEPPLTRCRGLDCDRDGGMLFGFGDDPYCAACGQIPPPVPTGGFLSLLHSTSWNQDGPHLILTYVAVVNVPGEFVLSAWPGAKPVSPQLLPAVGDPAPHGAADPPEVRDADPLFHALRHLAFLREYDAGARKALVDPWPRHLAAHGEALAGMYGRDMRPVELTPEPC